MGGSVGSGLAGLEFYDPNPTRPAIKKKFITQPNPTHQALKTDPTWRAGLGRVGFGRLAPNMNCNNFLEFFFFHMIDRSPIL